MTSLEQYVLPLFDHDLYLIDDFITSTANQIAYDAINNWSVNWGRKPYEKTLLLYGPQSSGKTYLAKIWQNSSKAFFITKNIDTYSNDLENWNVKQGVNERRVQLVREHMKSPKFCETNSSKKNNILSGELVKKYNAFIIEDIEFWDKEKLLHCFNLINEYGKYLLLTTGSLTNDFILPDLSSRINSIIRLELKQPDDELMRRLIFKHFSDHSVKVHDYVIKYLLINLPRKFDQMMKSLKFITHFALANKRTITVSLVKNALNENR